MDFSGDLIAVLDIDSNQPDAFTGADVDALSNLLKATFARA